MGWIEFANQYHYSRGFFTNFLLLIALSGGIQTKVFIF